MFDVSTDRVTLTVKRVPPIHHFTGEGFEGLPVVVFMAQANQKGPPIWWSIHIKAIHSLDWVHEGNLDIYTQILMGLERKNQQPRSDLTRVITTFYDLVRGKKKPVIYGNNDMDLLQAHFGNGCFIDVYRDSKAIQRVKDYGGYEGLVTVFGVPRTFFLYHRGVSLYNYLNENQAVAIVEAHLERLFPEVFAPANVLGVIQRWDRLRGKL